jgi:hypothetical protein
MNNADMARSISLPGQPSLKHAHERLNEMLTSADIVGLLQQLASRTTRKKPQFVSNEHDKFAAVDDERYCMLACRKGK